MEQKNNQGNFYPRKILSQLQKELTKDNILVLAGARQVGKTVLLHLLYKSLKNEAKIYFDLEDFKIQKELNNINFDDFVDYLKEKHNLKWKKRVYVFIDEIQYLDSPSSFLKYIFDHYKEIKFIVSGSSTLEIKKKFKDRLTGRKAFYEIMTLGFDEFLTFKKVSDKYIKLRKELGFRNFLKTNKKISSFDKKRIVWLSEDFLKLYVEFVIWGGYPKIVLAKSQEDKISELKEIHSTYVRKDIKDLAEIGNLKGFNNLVEIAASQIGQLINLVELTNSLSLSRETLERYLFLLENTFIFDLLKPFWKNKRKEISKMPKIFFEDTGLRNMLIQNFSSLDIRPDKGQLIENVVYLEIKKNLSLLENLYFWRTQLKTEVDFILKQGSKIIPIEVKYTIFKSPQIPKGLRSFIETNNPEKAFIITRDYFNQIKFKKTQIYFIPIFLV